MKVLYIANHNESDRTTVDVVCAGDSLTGWNNYGPVQYWPYPTYPSFLQEMCGPLNLRIADGGIAGEISDNGLGHVRRYLDLFPTSRYFIIGFGTNDLGTWPDQVAASQRIICNLDNMVMAIIDSGKSPLLFNIPYANESMFPAPLARDTHEKRDYHNAKLGEYCQKKEIPLAEVCSYLTDEHFGDELHPNALGAQIIAERVFEVLNVVYEAG
jgi:lysophospholipase L1-like esterase